MKVGRVRGQRAGAIGDTLRDSIRWDERNSRHLRADTSMNLT